MTEIFNRFKQKSFRQALRHKPTRPEYLLWDKLRDRQFHGYKFRRQHGIGKYVVDFYCPELKLALEADGANHFFNQKSEVYEANREFYLQQLDVKVIRISNTDITNDLARVLENLSQIINNR